MLRPRSGWMKVKRKQRGVRLSVLLDGQIQVSCSPFPLQWSSGINLKAGWPEAFGVLQSVSLSPLRVNPSVWNCWYRFRCSRRVVLSNINPSSLRWSSGINLDAEWPEAFGVLHSVSQSFTVCEPIYITLKLVFTIDLACCPIDEFRLIEVWIYIRLGRKEFNRSKHLISKSFSQSFIVFAIRLGLAYLLRKYTRMYVEYSSDYRML